jgi:hypothetical protein
MTTINLDAVWVRISKPTPDAVVGTSNITEKFINRWKGILLQYTVQTYKKVKI